MAGINELKKQIDEYRLRPVKSLGQNFLTDTGALKRIVSLLDLNGDDTVIEIGPGTGALTDHFAGKCRRAVLIEIDKHLIPVLKDRFGSYPEIEIKNMDALKVDFAKMLSSDDRAADENGRVSLVSNLPYYATNTLMYKFVTTVPAFDRIVVTVQTEAAQRLTAGPDSEGYGPVPVLADLLFDVKIVDKIPPHCFYPQPGVESSVMLMDHRLDILPGKSMIDGFAAFLKVVFGQRRKKMSRLIENNTGNGKTLNDIVGIIGEAGYPETVRAQEIPPLKLWQIFKKIYAP